MPGASSRRPRLGSPSARRALALVAGGLAGALALPGAAQGAFPGENGRIAFSSDRDGAFAIYSMEPDGSDVEQLTAANGTDFSPTYSPDGTRIAFGSSRSGTSFDIYEMSADGSAETPLITNTPSVSEFTPSYSPDGQQIVYQRQGDIWVMDADGSDQTPLTTTTSPAEDRNPVFSPDGGTIAFDRFEPGAGTEIYSMNADGSSPVNLTQNAVTDQRPDFSPDGERIVFERKEDPFGGAYDLISIDVDGSDELNLTPGGGDEQEASYSPDGQRIAFGGFRDFLTFDVWTMGADGSDQVNLTDNNLDPGMPNDSGPAWGPVPVGDACDPLIAERTWDGSAGSDWFEPANWTPSGIPASDEDVCVPAAAPTAPVIDNPFAEATARSVESFKQIAVDGGGLHLFSTSQPSLLHDDLGLGAGTVLVNSGSLTVQGNLSWNGGTIAGSGTTTVAEDGLLLSLEPNTDRSVDQQRLVLDGHGTLRGDNDGASDNTYLSNGAVLEVGGSLRLEDDQNILALTGDTLVDLRPDGALARRQSDLFDPLSARHTSVIAAPVDNDGEIIALTPATRATPSLRLTGGSGAETSTGQFVSAGDSVLELGGGATHSIGPRPASDPNFGNANFVSYGEVVVSPGTTLAAAGATGVFEGTSLVLDGSTLASSGTMTVDGHLEWGEGSTIAGSGTTRIAPGATLDNGGGDQRHLDAATLRVDGTATLSGDQDTTSGDDLNLANDATLEVGSGGLLELRRAQDLWAASGAGTVHVLAGGRLLKRSGPAVNRFNGTFHNEGTVEVTSGELRLEVDGDAADFVNYDPVADRLTGGAYIVRNGARFSFADAAVRTNAAVIRLDGPGSAIGSLSAQDALAGLAANAIEGRLDLRGDLNFSTSRSFVNDGVLDLDPQSTFSTAGGFTQGYTGMLTTRLTGTVPGAGYGQVSAAGAAKVNGTLAVPASRAPRHGEVFDVVTAGSTRTGTFAFVPSTGYDVRYLPDRVRLVPPSLRIRDQEVTEPAGAGATTTIRVDLSSPSAATVEVDYQTADDTAKAPADYTQTSGTLTFAPGETSEYITVPVATDALDEIHERFRILLDAGDPRFANVVDGEAFATIRDDDPKPALSVADAAPRTEGGRSAFRVSLSAPSGRRITVPYATEDGTASAPADYAAKAGTLVFAAGQTLKTISVSSVQDALDEPNEQFRLRISTPTAASIADASGFARIIDDD